MSARLRPRFGCRQDDGVPERTGDRVLALLNSGGLAATQAVINVLRKRAAAEPAPHPDGCLDVRRGQSGGRRDVQHRTQSRPVSRRWRPEVQCLVHPWRPDRRRRHAALSHLRGGQLHRGRHGHEPSAERRGHVRQAHPRLGGDPSATLDDATKCVLVSFDSTMLSNLSVGMPIDLLCYARDSLKVTMTRRFDTGDAYFESLKQQWIAGTRKVFRELPPLAL